VVPPDDEESKAQYIAHMTDCPKRPRDPNQLAKLIVDIATGSKASETHIALE